MNSKSATRVSGCHTLGHTLESSSADRGWERLTPEALDYAESHFGGSGWMGRRGWYAAEGGKGGWIAVAAAGNAVRATGLLGLTPEEAQITEVDKSLVAGSFFAADAEATCFLPLDMAEALGIGVGDQVEVFGRTPGGAAGLPTRSGWVNCATSTTRV